MGFKVLLFKSYYSPFLNTPQRDKIIPFFLHQLTMSTPISPPPSPPPGPTNDKHDLELSPFPNPNFPLQIPRPQPAKLTSDLPPHLPPTPALEIDSLPSSPPLLSKPHLIAIIATLSGISFLNTMGSGILIAALPTIALEVSLPQSLLLWPAAVYALSAGCLLLPLSAVADILGTRHLWISGSFLFLLFTLAVGLAKTGIQIILFRTVQGAAMAMCLPTSVSIIVGVFPRGGWRNVAFAMNGMGQPLGYATGLVLGGVFTGTVGWRWAYYMMAGANLVVSLGGVWALRGTGGRHADGRGRGRWERLRGDVDWVGTGMVSVGMGVLLYVLAVAPGGYLSLRRPENVVLLVGAVGLLGTFPWWMGRQERRGRPALIPNRLWRNAAFTSVCVSVFFCWAALNGIEYFSTLFFQQIQGLSPLQSSIRFLPHVLMGAVVNILMSYLISRVKVSTLVVLSAVVTLVAPPLMATVKVDANYWHAPFWAMLLSPANPDVLFTVSNLVISDAFPLEFQSLAGGVFNEVAQFGNSAGLAIMGAIAASVTEHSREADHTAALMEGYRAAFWTIFACCAVVLVVSLVGLRNAGTVGKKRE
ncbi:integral membrane protein [Lasiosphaeria ovina]|uniref:Integral membrane protein n=1 Tax=Lasiosphaeria ovina TaxID=92902 RepID=A0AAE0JRM7_9PEZI|nr:integral membrane protein [Lasiosphaeria ovina]